MTRLPTRPAPVTAPVLLAAALALTGCAEQAARFEREAGSQIDEGGFGNATMANTLAMTGQRSYVVDLNRRFAQEVSTQVNFAFNSADLTPEARATLDRQAHWIAQFPEVRFRVYGHTDLVGSAGYNRALGLRRAQAVVAHLAGRGISRARLEAVTSLGETQPLVATTDPEIRNRRTVTEVTGFDARHPTVLNGKYAQIIFREYVASAVPSQSGNELVEISN